MTASILIRSWRADREFLRYCLRSLRKFARGFQEIVVVIPDIDRIHFEGFEWFGERVVWIDEPDDGLGYLRQQQTKVNADNYTKSDLIFLLDSDCFAMKEFRPEDFMENDRPIALIRHWIDVGEAILWKPVVEKFLTFPACFETMAALPVIFDRRMLPLLHNYSLATHGISLDEYIIKQTPNQFSEFNAALNFAMRFCPYMYSWRIANPGCDGFPRDRIVQRWSWSEKGVDPFRAEYEAILNS
jgi:hypothetical protein